MAFATAQELSAYTMGLIPADDPRSESLLNGATKAIQNYCGWDIAPAADVTVVLDGAVDVLYLPSLKVNSITSLTISGTVVDISDLEWSRVTGNVRLRNHMAFPDVWGSIEVKFNSGYTEVPEDLKQIVMQVSSIAMSSPTGATREQAGQVSMQWATTAPGVAGGLSLLDRDFQTINHYKLPKV